jgi:hypothetical protein
VTTYSPLPTANLTPRDFDDRKLEETDGALTISLWDGDSRTASLSFSFVYCYRKRVEGDALETLHEIGTTSELGHLLYVGDDSAFMSWFTGKVRIYM